LPKVIAYIRVSTDRQDVNNQRLEILDYARRNDFKVDDFIEIEVSSRKSQKDRRIEELMEKLAPADTLIVSELSRLGRSTSEVIDLVNEMIGKKVNLFAIKQGLRISSKMDMQTKVIVTMFSLFAELERDIISERTKAALAGKKANGVRLGKPKGTIQASKLDDKQDMIRELLKHQVSKSAIARMVGTSRTNLSEYIQRRGLGNM
jgi:putative DNA-invertase from lambdoid prophage Rac